MDASSWSKQQGGFYAFDRGHLLLWTAWADPTNRPAYKYLDEWKEKYGKERAEWMIAYLRNLCIYPNVYFMDQFGSQIRVWRPLSVNRTEVTIYCIAPVGEDAADRAHRIRQYEDFFNVSGMATPDDLEEFRACQAGYAGKDMEWNDISRGATHWVNGPDENAAKINLHPKMSGLKTEDEGLFVMQHQYWLDTMKAALDKEQATLTL
jgi:benzoate/toluate 1,2-dioxygenase alpha subunit